MRIESLPEESSLAAQNSKRHRQVKRRSFLANVRRGEIYGNNLSEGEIETAVAHGGLDPLAAFFDSDIRQPDNAKTALKAGTYIHLDFDEVCVDAEYRCAECFEKHPKWLEGVHSTCAPCEPLA